MVKRAAEMGDSFGRGGKAYKRGSHEPEKNVAKKPGKTKSLKAQIRSLQRYLRLDDIDTRARQAVEEKIKQLEDKHRENAQSEHEKRLYLKYKRVRFFERVKIERKINKTQTALKAAGDEQNKAELQAQLRHQEEDLQYVMHFPRGELYVSVLREGENQEAQAELNAKRDRLRKLVKQQLAEQAILAEANEGHPTQLSHNTTTPARQREAARCEDEDSSLKEERVDEANESSDSKADIAPPQPKQRTARMVPATELQAAPLAGHDRSGNGTVQTAEPSEKLLRGLAAEDDFFLPSDAEGPAPTQGTLQAPLAQEWVLDSDALVEAAPPGHQKKRGKKDGKKQKVPKKAAPKKQVEARKAAVAVEKAPLRTRAEGGRKRRKKAT